MGTLAPVAVFGAARDQTENGVFLRGKYSMH